MKLTTFKISVVFCLCSLVLVSCKKSDANAPDNKVANGTREELTRDSLFLYAKDVYLWNTNLPDFASFNPRKYDGTLAGYDKELYDITQFSPVNTSTGKPYEYPLDPVNEAGVPKYSYIDDISTHNVLASVRNEKSSVDLEGIGNDFGFKVGAYSTSSSAQAYAIYVQAVYQGSPADVNKLTRGALITKINGTSYGANFNNEINAVNTALNASSIKLEGLAKDGVTPFSITLNKTTYKSSPVYLSKVLDVNGVKVGYLAYARFSALTNSQADFDAAFTAFAAQGVKKLVIDLRYNGGGYVETAQYLINMIIPSGVTGIMFKERYNAQMQAGNATILKNQPLYEEDGSFQYTDNGRVANYSDLAKDYFSEAKQTTNVSKKGPLSGVTDVAFIVTRSTASASELVINSLKPYLNVKIAGTKSYGKPVGFFPITINYKLDATTKKETGYDVYYSMFQSTNSLGQGDYFDGFTPDAASDFDDATHDFGDLKENYLAKALALIVPSALTNTSSTMAIRGSRVSTSTVSVKRIFDGNEFNGMIAKRPRLKK
jgi:carboxyl-terminal processing protease